MIFGICLLLVIFILWMLLVEGWLWKLALLLFGWIGMYFALHIYIPDSSAICFSAGGYDYSWKIVIPTFVCFMAAAYSGDKE